MNRKKITALLLSSVMAFTPAMPAMAEQSTIIDYVDGTTDSTVETPDVTPTPLPEKKEGWETVDGVKYYYVNAVTTFFFIVFKSFLVILYSSCLPYC